MNFLPGEGVHNGVLPKACLPLFRVVPGIAMGSQRWNAWHTPTTHAAPFFRNLEAKV